MPFKIITTVIHEGPPDLDEQLIVTTTVGKRVCTVSRGKVGKNFMLHPSHWPKAVSDAALELVSELRHRGKAVDKSDLVAWIDSKQGLVVGNKVQVLLVCEGYARTKTIILRGTITGFTIP